MNISLNLRKDVYEHPRTKKRIYVYTPRINVILIGNHNVTPPILSYIDTGAVFNIFPMECATNFLGFTQKGIKKVTRWDILGVGGADKVGYGIQLSIYSPDFRIDRTMVYFVENQPYPLLGVYGFIDQFKSFTINNETKKYELIK